MKVLVVGGGGREHTLAWALGRSRSVIKLRCAPGNAGIARDAEPVDIGAEDVEGLLKHAADERYDLVVVGPEVPLVQGLADRLQELGIPVFGPSAGAALMEGSKVFSKEFMARHGIPTARFLVFSEISEATAYLSSPDASYPCVVKADGLAAGKGVIMCPDAATAMASAEGMLSGHDFGEAGRRIVVEEMLFGTEASFFVLADGERFVELTTCQDYKRARDGDQGRNTGGMGTYSPSAHLDDRIRRIVLREIVEPSIQGMKSEGHPYQGVLYIGLMLTEDGPKVLEYNCRFGDPETQVLLPRLDGDWFELLNACARGELDDIEPKWIPEAAVCVVMASGGYPGGYEKGKIIEGIDEAAGMPGVVVFHAGTKLDDEGRIVTAGGRVLGVTALGTDIAAARDLAYEAVSKIHWDGERHRSDIALDALQAVPGEVHRS